jgi:cation:H+ antiporter
MYLITNIFLFLFSFLILFFSSSFLVENLKQISRFLKWKEFVVSFFTIALATTIPNLVIDTISALNKVSNLAFGDVVGTNICDLTLIVGLSAIISKAGLSVPSRTVQGSAIFTILVGILPILLVLDGNLNKIDGILLLCAFFLYLSWLFQKRERFEKVYDKEGGSQNLKTFLKNLIFFIFSGILLYFAGQQIVKSAIFFSNYFNLDLSIIGILIVGLGNALPELTFTLQAARKSQDWFIVGDVMGSVILTATLVLGIAVLISPIENLNLSPFFVGRIFLLISALFFLIFIKTGRKITPKEGYFLILIYFLFLLFEILTQIWLK